MEVKKKTSTKTTTTGEKRKPVAKKKYPESINGIIFERYRKEMGFSGATDKSGGEEFYAITFQLLKWYNSGIMMQILENRLKRDGGEGDEPITEDEFDQAISALKAKLDL
jgi:hypothetical protein